MKFFHIRHDKVGGVGALFQGAVGRCSWQVQFAGTVGRCSSRAAGLVLRIVGTLDHRISPRSEKACAGGENAIQLTSFGLTTDYNLVNMTENHYHAIRHFSDPKPETMTPKTPSGRPALPYLLRRLTGPVVFLFAPFSDPFEARPSGCRRIAYPQVPIA